MYEYDELIARTYDAVYAAIRGPSRDAEFYFEIAREVGGPVLELGCGTGRVLLPIARAGMECTGIDASEAMLRELRAKDPPANLTVVHGDMQHFDLKKKFQLVTMPFRAFSHLLDVSAQLECLACVREHLAPGGVFAFDVFDPKPDKMAKTTEPETLGVTFPFGGNTVRRYETVNRDHTTQVLTVRFRFEGEVSGEVTFKMRWFHRYEIEHLLARAGFEPTFFGGFDRSPWRSGAETIVVARQLKRERER